MCPWPPPCSCIRARHGGETQGGRQRQGADERLKRCKATAASGGALCWRQQRAACMQLQHPSGHVMQLCSPLKLTHRSRCLRHAALQHARGTGRQAAAAAAATAAAHLLGCPIPWPPSCSLAQPGGPARGRFDASGPGRPLDCRFRLASGWSGTTKPWIGSGGPVWERSRRPGHSGAAKTAFRRRWARCTAV